MFVVRGRQKFRLSFREKQLEGASRRRRCAMTRSRLLKSDFEAANERFYDRKTFRLLFALVQVIATRCVCVCAKMSAVYQF